MILMHCRPLPIINSLLAVPCAVLGSCRALYALAECSRSRRRWRRIVERHERSRLHRHIGHKFDPVQTFSRDGSYGVASQFRRCPKIDFVLCDAFSLAGNIELCHVGSWRLKAVAIAHWFVLMAYDPDASRRGKS